jgi:thiosulfate/3-mercaptopyruvate sulfurtransferase
LRSSTVLETLGFNKVKVYDSSWLGYAARLDAPAERETFFNVGAMNGRLQMHRCSARSTNSSG